MIGRFGLMHIPDLERHRGRLLLIQAMRVGFFILILFSTIFFQLRQSTFFNTDSLFPFYILLITAFTLSAAYLFFFETTQKLWPPTAFLFGYDTVFVTTLVYITGLHQSIFLFLYLVNIILCSLVFQRTGALLIALFTSICFSLLLILGPEIHGQTLYYTVGLNNLAFFSVAALSGYLSEQMNFMGATLRSQSKDIKTLKDINKIIFDNISSGLITISKEKKVLLCNKSAIKILSLQQNPMGKLIDEILPSFSEIIKSSETRFEMRYTLPNDERILLGFSLSSLRGEDNSVNGYIIIFQDLTEIIRLENAMRRQEKLAAVGKLAAGIAHEIRNPLASISGSIELLKSGLELKTPEQNKLMDIMLKEVSRLNAFITEFLEFVRPEHRKLEVCNVDQILNEALDIVKLNQTLSQKVVQERKINSRSYVSGDKNKLKQVFLNLIINAYQAMQSADKSKLTAMSFVEDGQVIVKIKDTGHGMSEQTMKRLFEPFFTTKPKGTGLGLATAHKILEIHEAKIFVESREGQGTEFTIQFSMVIKQGDHINESQNTGSG